MIGLTVPLLLALAAPAPAADDRFGGLWSDWTRLARDAAEAEAMQGRAQKPAPPAKAEALGERVGEIVAAGDCEEGERIALDAGDVTLARAVRDYCAVPSAGR